MAWLLKEFLADQQARKLGLIRRFDCLEEKRCGFTSAVAMLRRFQFLARKLGTMENGHIPGARAEMCRMYYSALGEYNMHHLTFHASQPLGISCLFLATFIASPCIGYKRSIPIGAVHTLSFTCSD